MDLLLFLLVGLAMGALSRLLTTPSHEPVPGRQNSGWGISFIVGVLGALLGGILGRALGMYKAGEVEGILMALGCSVLLLFGYHAAALRRTV